jgi:hypothetical protein
MVEVALAFSGLTQDRTQNAETARTVDTPNLFTLPPGTAVRCRPSISCNDHPIAAHIGDDDLPSSFAGWWPNRRNLDSTTCAYTTLRKRKILHIDLPNGFSVSLQEP